MKQEVIDDSRLIKHSAGMTFLRVLACSMLIAATARAKPSWDFSVHISAQGQAEVEWTLRGFSGPLRVCADREGGGVHVSKLRPVVKRSVTIRKADDDDDCWDTEAPAGKPLRLTYRMDLKQMTNGMGDPDWASMLDGAMIFTDETLLLRPDPLPPHAEINVEFHLGPGETIVAPWTRTQDEPPRFQTTSDQFDGGSYVAIGALTPLGEVPVRGGVFDVTEAGANNHVPADVLREWVRSSGAVVADFYHGLPAPHVEVILGGVSGSEGGVFGSTLRRGHPSVVLFFSRDAPAENFQGRWMPMHELFHLGNPAMEGRAAWFTEGTATYYQDVLRGRAHLKDAATMWGDLYDGFRRFCQPEDEHSLESESEHLWDEFHFRRVYWGAACLLFRVDVAIRKRSGGHRSLDDVLRELLARGRKKPLRESELIAALDTAAGSHLASEQLRTTKPIELERLYRQLGIEPTGDDTVALHDDAPLAGIRRAIFE